MLERPDQPRNAFAWMDCFRAVAAFMVAISHVRDIFWRDALPGDPLAAKLFYLLTGFGHIGVVVFFVLSGFWITRSVMKRVDKPGFWPDYLVDRLVRLLIVLLPVLVICGLLDWYGVHVLRSANYIGLSDAHSISGPVSERLGWPELLGAPLFLSKIVVDPLGSNGPLWSLSYEFWYYLWFPALAFLLWRRRVGFALLTLAVAFFSFDLLLGFVSWLAGSALHFVLRVFAPTQRQRWEAPFFGTSALILAALLFAARIVQQNWFDPLVALGFAAFLFGLCRLNLHFPKVLTPLASFGSIGSFSLYALHFPVAMMLAGWFSGGVRAEPSLQLLGFTSATMAAVLVAALVFARFTEHRTDKVRAAIKRRLGLIGGVRQGLPEDPGSQASPLAN